MQETLTAWGGYELKRPIADLAISEEEENALRAKYPKADGQRLNRKWSFFIESLKKLLLSRNDIVIYRQKKCEGHLRTKTF